MTSGSASSSARTGFSAVQRSSGSGSSENRSRVRRTKRSRAFSGLVSMAMGSSFIRRLAARQPQRPGAVGFEKGHLEPRMALADAARNKAAQPEHLGHRLGIDAPQPEVGVELLANLC